MALRPAIRRAAAVLALIALFLGPAGALAFDLPPSETGRSIYDFAGIWTPATIGQAQAIVDGIRTRTKAEVAVVSIPTGLSSVSLETARSDAKGIMDAWGVGRAGVNDGLVVLFDMDTSNAHGQIYLYAGSGFRDLYLSDADVTRITDTVMRPSARAGNLDEAVLGGLREIDAAAVAGGNPNRGRIDPGVLLGAIAVGAGAVAFLAAFALTWWRRGRDARMPTIDDSVLLPAPPPTLTPALAAVLRLDVVDVHAYTAALMDLGHRGLLVVHPSDENRALVDFLVPPQPVADPGAATARLRPLGPAESGLVDELRAKAGPLGGEIPAATLRGGLGSTLAAHFQTGLGQAAAASGWFVQNPGRIVGRWDGYGAIALVVAGIGFWLSASDSDTFVAAGREPLAIAWAALAVFGVVVLLLARRLVARTVDGAYTLAMALAYRNTLRYELVNAPSVQAALAGTTSRLAWITTPDQMMVWAVALGLEHEADTLLARSAETMATGGSTWAPAWYAGASLASFGSAVGSISTTASSSSGGGFGGGSSGGGGGGGGSF